MKLKVLGSSSAGNCYLLHNDTEALIIEAGLPFLEVKKALNFNVKKIVGVVVGHAHQDHAKYVAEYKSAGINVFQLFETSDEMQLRKYGGFIITAFPLVHDVPCHGFHIYHKDIGKLIYATDTEYIKWRFSHVNHILVEANYSDDLIDYEAINREHVLRGHMSLQTALDFISTNDNPALRNVVLIHLSDKNADSAEFLQKTKETTKYGADVYVASKGLTISLDLLPF